MSSAEKLDENQEAGKPRILLVDEHVVTAEIERSFLTGVGFEVELVTTADAAIDAIGATSFDLIMVDTSFRGDRGVETLQALRRRSRNPEVKSIVTGLSFPPPLKKKARDAGASEIFVKPAPRPQVLREIKRLTDSKSRGNERIPHSLSLVLLWDEQTYNCRTLDLSSDGVHLSTLTRGGQEGTRPPVGSSVEMDIQLTGKESISKVAGVVRRHTKEGFGVSFGEMKKSDRKKLDKYVLKHSLEQATSHYYL